MKLFKILDSIEKGAKVLSKEQLAISSSLHLERYAESVAVTGRTLAHDLTISEGVVKIGNERLDVVNKKLRLGYTDVLKNIYKINDIPRPLSMRITEDIEGLSSARIGQHERFNEQFKSKLSEKLSKDVYDHLTTPGKEVTEEMVKNNKVLEDIFNLLKNKSLRPITGAAIVLFGVSTATIALTVNKRMHETRGCFAYYTRNGILQSCKIVSCSCGTKSLNPDCGKHCTVCRNDILSAFPNDMLNIHNCDNINDEPCVKCPSEDFGKHTTANLTDENPDFSTLERSDQLYVKCNNPSVVDTMTDLYGQLGEDLLDVVDNAAQATSFIFRNIKNILIYGGIAAAIIAVLVLLIKFGPSTSAQAPAPVYVPLKETNIR